MALSACLAAASALLVPGIIGGASVPLSYPALVAEACWVGARADLFSAPWPSPLHCSVLSGASLSPLSPPSALWGLRALRSAPRACPLRCRAGMHWFWVPGPSLSVSGLMCSPFRSPGPPSVQREFGAPKTLSHFFFWKRGVLTPGPSGILQG